MIAQEPDRSDSIAIDSLMNFSSACANPSTIAFSGSAGKFGFPTTYASFSSEAAYEPMKVVTEELCASVPAVSIKNREDGALWPDFRSLLLRFHHVQHNGNTVLVVRPRGKLYDEYLTNPGCVLAAKQRTAPTGLQEVFDGSSRIGERASLGLPPLGGEDATGGPGIPETGFVGRVLRVTRIVRLRLRPAGLRLASMRLASRYFASSELVRLFLRSARDLREPNVPKGPT